MSSIFSRDFWYPPQQINNSCCQQLQTQQQIFKQEQQLLQLQAQYNSNRLLTLLLSSAENVAAKINPRIERIYTDHDFGHSFESKSLDSLVLQLIEQIETFESSYKRYKKEFKKEYDFPYDQKIGKGISKIMIIEDMNYLIDNTKKFNNYYSKFFRAIISILNDKPIPNFDSDVDNLDINDKNREKKCNPKELQQIYPILLEQGNEEKKEIEDNYNKNKNFKIIIEKSDPNNNNEFYEKKIQQKLKMMSNYEEKPDKIKKKIRYSKLKSFNNNFDDFPSIVVNNIDKIILKNENYSKRRKTLLDKLKKNENSNINEVLNKFFKDYYCNEIINKIIDVTCDKIYESEFIFDAK